MATKIKSTLESFFPYCQRRKYRAIDGFDTYGLRCYNPCQLNEYRYYIAIDGTDRQNQRIETLPMAKAKAWASLNTSTFLFNLIF